MTTIRSERIVDQCPRCRSLDVIHFINEKLDELGAKRGVVVGRSRLAFESGIRVTCDVGYLCAYF